MTTSKKKTTTGAEMTRKLVIEYLRNHPDFLGENPEVWEFLTPPGADRETKVVDLQRHILASLQKSIRIVQEQYETLVRSSRDNMSTQAQVHGAALALIRVQGLEQLLERITLDLATLFDVDVVRLGVESEAAEFYDTLCRNQTGSGMVFLRVGDVGRMLPKGKPVLLCEDIAKSGPPGTEFVFSDCNDLVRSCALLRLNLASHGREAVLAFGVRHPGRFHAGQGSELLSFLAQIIELRLDACLEQADWQGA